MIVRAQYGDWTDILSFVPALLGSQSTTPTPPPPPATNNTALYIGAGLSALVLIGGFMLVLRRQDQGD